MKLSKMLISALLGTAIIVSSSSAVWAAEKTNSKKTTKTQKKQTKQTKQTKQSQQAKKAPTKLTPLQQFAQNVDVIFTGRNLATNAQGQTLVQFHFNIANKSTQQAISQLDWIAAFKYNNQIVFAQEVPLNFGNRPLQPRTQTSITINALLQHIEPQFRSLMGNPNVQLASENGAKSLVFSNGSQIVVQ